MSDRYSESGHDEFRGRKHFNADDFTSTNIEREGRKVYRSPMKNVESKDYSPKDFMKRSEIVEKQCHIIADPFKPTLNKWIRKGSSEGPSEHYKMDHDYSMKKM